MGRVRCCLRVRLAGQVDGKKQNVTMFKIDIGANRYDLLSIEGLSRALRIFMEKEQAPVSARAMLRAAFRRIPAWGAQFLRSLASK